MNTESKPYLFIHIPKNAGNSVMKLFEDANIPLDIKRHYPNCYPDGTIKMFLLGITGYGCWQNFYSFAFVRNPYSRVQSAFIYLMRGGLQDLDKSYRDTLLSYGSFEQCCKALKFLRKRIVHLVSQQDILCDDNDNVLASFVGKCENFDEDIKKVAPFINESIQINRSSDFTNNQELTPDIQQMIDDASHLTPETKELIYAAYEKDFIIFGYEK